MKSLYSIEKKQYRSVLEDLKLIELKDEWIVYNSITLGWGILNKKELEILLNVENADKEYCTKLYKIGLIQCNGQYIYAHDSEIDDTINYFEINMTNSCNMQCKYCVSNFNFCKNTVAMSKKTARNIVDKLKKYIKEENIDNIVIEFSGGEPLLNFDVIQEFINQLEDVQCNISYVIQTNGLLLDVSKIQFIKKNKKIQLAISIDGISEKQNSNRVDRDNKSTLEKVVCSIKKIKANNIPFGVVIVVSEQNIDDMEQIIQYFIENDLTETFSLLPLLPFGAAKENHLEADIKEYIAVLMRLHEKYLLRKNMEVERVIVERNVGVISSYVFSPSRGYICNQNPCGAGRKIVSIGPTGKVYPCYGFQEIEEFLLGDIDNGFNISEIKKSEVVKKLHMRDVEKIKKCSECAYKLWCNGGCVTNAYLNSKDIMQRDEIYCNINKSIIEKIIYEYINNDEMKFYLKKIKKQWDII